MRPVLFPLLFAGLLAACTQGPVWQKAGISDDDRQRDMVDCRRQADAQAERESHARGARVPQYDFDPSSGQIRETFRAQSRSAGLSEKSLSEQYYGRCMTARGYRQV